ncbi:MAG: septum formation initiator family protein [Myxococcota bacterium]
MSRKKRRRAAGPLARDAWPRRRKWPWLVLVLLIMTVIAASSGDYGLVRLFRLRAEHDRLLTRNLELEADNARLAQNVRRLRKDRHAIEKIAREELGMVKADEIVYQVRP